MRSTITQTRIITVW